jgi:hypothetical protein
MCVSDCSSLRFRECGKLCPISIIRVKNKHISGTVKWVGSLIMGVHMLVTVSDCLNHIKSENCCKISKKMLIATQ